MEIFVEINDRREGPFTLEQLKQRMHSRDITLATLAWQPGWAEWKRVTEIPELLDLIVPPLPEHRQKLSNPAHNSVPALAANKQQSFSAAKRRRVSSVWIVIGFSIACWIAITAITYFSDRTLGVFGAAKASTVVITLFAFLAALVQWARNGFNSPVVPGSTGWRTVGMVVYGASGLLSLLLALSENSTGGVLASLTTIALAVCLRVFRSKTVAMVLLVWAFIGVLMLCFGQVSPLAFQVGLLVGGLQILTGIKVVEASAKTKAS